MLIRSAEVGGERADLRVRGCRIAQIAARLDPLPGEAILEASGGALLPGLHDHHIHLLALAAAQRSVRCGPPEVAGREGLATALANAPGDGWIRGVGYHESVAGLVSRDDLDALEAKRPVRIQHRTGALWIVNSEGARLLELDDANEPGVERDASGRPTGRLHRLDAWLRTRTRDDAQTDLAPVSARLARAGVTGFTDATPHNARAEVSALAAAVDQRALVQRLVVMGSAELEAMTHARIERGAWKVLLDENALPEFDTFCAAIARMHAARRGVAIHCVTRAELVFAVAAFEAAGAGALDRIEHASIAPRALRADLARLGITVVTQPNFVRERGDAYLREVDPVDRADLYACGRLIEDGVPTGGGTDAPFGDPDPWLAMQAAVDRRTAGAASLGPEDAISPERALALFTTPPFDPGGVPRQIAVGGTADLCLLDRPWSRARDALSSAYVAATVCDGQVVHARDGDGSGAPLV